MKPTDEINGRCELFSVLDQVVTVQVGWVVAGVVNGPNQRSPVRVGFVTP